jgi:alginate O-acetyltransferase complex protein AlgI
LLFNSFQFFVFFPVVTILYFLLPHRFRWACLLAASCYFYMAFIPVYILVLFFTIGVDYLAGISIEGAQGSRRRLFLAASLLANIGVLAVFKYAGFLDSNLAALAGFLHWNYPIQALAIILPIGLSFHTFQSMSYTIEVYWGRHPAERHLGIFALYVMFFPQLVAGPIERPQNLLPQLHATHEMNPEQVSSGLQLMAWGLFKKMVVADRLAILVNQVYNDPTEYQGISLIIATVFFAYQIYCDFSGYSDIAVGAAQVLGIRLRKNFDRPYSARSIGDFWHKWHMSLSTWFRDYLYIPLGGSRTTRARWYLNLLITFLVSGLWHGANWTFVIWGALHGFYMLVSIWTQGIYTRLKSWLRLDRLPALKVALETATTFGLVCFAWIFFRSNNLADSLYVVSHLIPGIGNSMTLATLRGGTDRIGMDRNALLFSVGLIAVLELVQFLQARYTLNGMLAARPVWVRWAAYYVLVMSILLLGVFSERAFIYFQF